MNVLDLLHEDHETVNRLFTNILATSNAEKARREALFETLRSELIRHSHAEEEVFYPPLRAKQQTHEIIEEGINEHHHVEDGLARLSDIAIDRDEWLAGIRMLRKAVEHHVEEEETEVFPQARKLLSERDLEGMTAQVQAVKREDID